MRRVLLSLSAVILGVACGPGNLQRNAGSASTPEQSRPSSATTLSPVAPVDDLENEKPPPPEFVGVDFKNLSYPAELQGRIKLKDGKAEYANKDLAGGDTFEFHGVNYVDLEGDGKLEAVVGLTAVSCGVSCDGGSHLFYVFASDNGRPKLLGHLETGSLAYDCGLKSFALAGRELTLELFRTCAFGGTTFEVNLMDDTEGKFIARTFTRFQFSIQNNEFVQKKREVLPFVPGDAKNFTPTITITGK